MTYKRFISALLVLCLTACLMPLVTAEETTAQAVEEAQNEGTRVVRDAILIDDDATGGYDGDYVVIYNGSSSSSSSASTGTMTGLIQTSISSSQQTRESSDEPELNIIDVDSMMPFVEREQTNSATRKTYSVGDTKSFTISYYSPSSSSQGSGTVTFKLVYAGAHCYIWEPTNSAYYPLSTIDSTYPETVANVFDSKFDLMQSSFGDFSDPQSNGKVNLMFYNINDGWSGISDGYVAGYFYSGDLSSSSNNMPMIHIDTMPGIQYTNNGTTYTDVVDCYGTMVHEFQHLINYSETGGMDTWLNEGFSGAAEEVCFPGSGLYGRIRSWNGASYSSYTNPPTEYTYNSNYDLHKGGSMYTWNNNASDIYARYAIVMLFSQYLFTQKGNTIYKTVIDSVASGTAAVTAVANAMGVSSSDLIKNFATAMIGNSASSYNGLYSLSMQAGYDPTSYSNIQDMYSLLGAVIFTGSSATIYGGGFITVKPVNGNYVPPSGASSSLKYVGITLNASADPYANISPTSMTVKTTKTGTLTVNDNLESASYTWSCSDTTVATISASGSSCVVTGVKAGTATVQCIVTDGTNSFTLTSVITVVTYVPDLWVRTTTIEAGEEYLIGSEDGSTVYLMSGTNNASLVNAYTFLEEGAATKTTVGAVLGTADSTEALELLSDGSDISTLYQWTFSAVPTASSYAYVQNVSTSGYLRRYDGNYNDLYTQSSSGTSTYLRWYYTDNGALMNSHGSYSSRYVAYTEVTTGEWAFSSELTETAVCLYKRYVPPTTFTVSWDDTVVGGTLSVTANGTAIANGASVDTGTVIVITATPDEWYETGKLSINDGTQDYGIDSGDSYTVTTNVTIEYSFDAIPYYTLTWAQSAGGTLSVTQNGTALTSPAKVAVDSTIVITATPDEGYGLADLMAGDIDVKSGDEFMVDADYEIAAVFGLIYTVTYVRINAVTNESETVASYEVISGDTLTAIPSPDKGSAYCETAWDVDLTNVAITQNYTVSSSYALWGDANLDGVLTVSDATVMLNHIVGSSGAALTGIALALSDVNGDGSITVVDVTLLLQRVVGTITSFPVEETK